MRFRYVALPTRRPVYPLGGAGVRYRPLVSIGITGPGGSFTLNASLDSGSDDTVFPAHLAGKLGIDLAGAPQGESRGIGGVPAMYHYAGVSLRLTDNYEECEWAAVVGFIGAPMRWAVLGHTGALQFFDIRLLGERREAIMEPNSSFPDRHTIRQPPPP